MLAPQQYAYLWKAQIKTSPKIGWPPKIMAFRGRCRPLKAPWLLVVMSNHSPLSPWAMIYWYHDSILETVAAAVITMGLKRIYGVSREDDVVLLQRGTNF